METNENLYRRAAQGCTTPVLRKMIQEYDADPALRVASRFYNYIREELHKREEEEAKK